MYVQVGKTAAPTLAVHIAFLYRTEPGMHAEQVGVIGVDRLEDGTENRRRPGPSACPA
jgi:hypothetical protein